MLEKINKANDIKRIPETDLTELAGEIRRFLVKNVSKTGGHLASNLGSVELTIALHRVYDLPKDKIIWDVGHQSYTHKILTGRKDVFDTLRQEDGLSGFPRRRESDCDSFDTGHSSTSVSAGLGYVYARDLQKKNYSVVSVIGDGALTGGLAFEALNNAARLKTNFVIVLNDNEMSISRNVGGLSDYLGRVRLSKKYNGLKMEVSSALEQVPVIGEKMINTIRKTKSSIKQLVIPGMLFENMGITYLGPVDGHDIKQLVKVLTTAKNFDGPVIVHAVTEKGKGYVPAELDPSRFHGISAFDAKTGKSLKPPCRTWSDVFSDIICSLAASDEKIAAITAAMKEGTGLKRFAALFPTRFFDVGIAEEHGVTFAAGLAAGGMIPVFAVYSTFLQRGFDELMMDVCLQKLHVVFAIDRAGFVGEDGSTHQGLFDISYLSMLPGMTILSPKDEREMKEMFKTAVYDIEGPVAIRYPRGAAVPVKEAFRPLEYGKGEILRDGSRCALLVVGSLCGEAEKAADILEEKGITCTVVNARFVKPFDTALITQLAGGHELFVTCEENIACGGFGANVLDYVNRAKLPVRVINLAVEDTFVKHASQTSQRKRNGLDAEGIAGRILEELS